MSSKINISVVIPVYNAQDTIISCLESVLNQTYSVSEIVIINDGSTDSSENIIVDFISSNDIKIIRLINQINGGPSLARNNGILNSTGNWIAFIDSDDKWLPNKIQSQVQVLNSYPDVSLISTLLFPNPKRTGYPLEFVNFKNLLFKNKVFTSTVLVRKEVFEFVRFDENKKYSEDYKLWLQIILRYKAVVINEGLVIYAVNSKTHKRNSLSSSLWKMEKGELDNFIYFFKKNEIDIFVFFLIVLWSFCKFILRLVFK